MKEPRGVPRVPGGVTRDSQAPSSTWPAPPLTSSHLASRFLACRRCPKVVLCVSRRPSLAVVHSRGVYRGGDEHLATRDAFSGAAALARRKECVRSRAGLQRPCETAGRGGGGRNERWSACTNKWPRFWVINTRAARKEGSVPTRTHTHAPARSFGRPPTRSLRHNATASLL
ncbi:hypothetical protein E2C01_059128 [Portunus trituberculatus]|uniref:Uncharacterized protein n=1 Tax=Portunus trituberculatus TaxID=210409 RepID=A0A5B7H5Z6_PORTR|nr:hypothetical protein [Portunus trituberculatus]